MKTVAVIFQIDNGYLITEVDDNGTTSGRTVFTKDFLLDSLFEPNHEAALRSIVLGFPEVSGKIPAIKAVREYCSQHNYPKYSGLMDAKVYVESVRPWLNAWDIEQRRRAAESVYPPFED